MDYVRYYFPVLLQLSGMAGIWAGGPWVWLGLLQLPALALVDGFLEYDGRERRAASETLMDVPLVVSTLLGFATTGLIAWRAGAPGVGALELAGMIATGGWLTVITIAPSSHELYHKRVAWKYWLGLYAQVLYLDLTRSVAHMSGHHLAVGTPEDPDTPPRGMNMYRFVLHAAVGNARDVLEWEKAAMAKRGLPLWSPRGRLGKAALTLGIFALVLFAIGGVIGMLAGLTVGLIGRVWLEAFNYLQHIGIVRAEGAPVGKRHVWNHLSPLTRMAAFEITNHCDHHQDAYIPYFRMKPDMDGPLMPSGFVCFFAAAVPPIWNRYVLQPRLCHWDLHYATAEERALAREANRKAGWPDWLGDAEARGSLPGASAAAPAAAR